MLIYVISVVLALVIAFFCGAIPVALIVGRSMRGIDVREHGSGNAGSTNAIRVLGTGPGLLVFAGDVLKGALGCVIVSVAIAFSITLAASQATDLASAALLEGSSTEAFQMDPLISILASDQSRFLYDVPMAMAIIVTILGHMFSPFMGFKGGKGVAAALGAVAVVLPMTAAFSFGVFLIVVLIWRYVSLGSIIAVITVPLFTCLFYPSPTFIVFTALLALVVVWAHRKNIVRLKNGKEPKFSFPKKGAASKSAEATVNGTSSGAGSVVVSEDTGGNDFPGDETRNDANDRNNL